MDRRQFGSTAAFTLCALMLAITKRAQALSLADLSNAEASQGLKIALEKGALAAVDLLGRPDGFLANPKVRIPLPGYFNDTAKFLRTLGQGKRIDELVTSMNRAAEAAVPVGKDLLFNAVRSMNVVDARKILAGGSTSVTDFFVQKTRAPLAVKFLPIITQTTQKIGLAEQYNSLAGKISGLGLVRQEHASIQQYVTGKTLDGLYLMIGDEEKKIRQDPAGSGSAVLKKVFGTLK